MSEPTDPLTNLKPNNIMSNTAKTVVIIALVAYGAYATYEWMKLKKASK